MTTSNRGSRRESERTCMPTGGRLGHGTCDHRHPPLTSAHYRHPTPEEVSELRGRMAKAIERIQADGRDAAEPFRLYRTKGSTRYRVTFCMSGVRYEGSTRCDDLDLAVMVSRAVYAEVKESAGRLPRDDVRRTARSVRSVRGTWLTLRPKRLPSTIADRA